MSGFIKNHSAKCSLVPAAAATHFCVASGRATVDGPMRRQGVTSSGPKPQFVRPWWGAWEGSVCPAIGGETDPPVLPLIGTCRVPGRGGSQRGSGPAPWGGPQGTPLRSRNQSGCSGVWGSGSHSTWAPHDVTAPSASLVPSPGPCRVQSGHGRHPSLRVGVRL